MKLGFLPVRGLPVLGAMEVVYFGITKSQRVGTHESMTVLTLGKSWVGKY